MVEEKKQDRDYIELTGMNKIRDLGVEDKYNVLEHLIKELVNLKGTKEYQDLEKSKKRRKHSSSSSDYDSEEELERERRRKRGESRGGRTEERRRKEEPRRKMLKYQWIRWMAL